MQLPAHVDHRHKFSELSKTYRERVIFYFLLIVICAFVHIGFTICITTQKPFNPPFPFFLCLLDFIHVQVYYYFLNFQVPLIIFLNIFDKFLIVRLTGSQNFKYYKFLNLSALPVGKWQTNIN